MLKNQKTAFSIEKGDLTELKVDVIVNAANTKLQHGSGLAGAIIKKVKL